MTKESVDLAVKNKIIRLITALAPDVKIYLFGSRAEGTHTETSDIDIALDNGEKLPLDLYGEIINVLEGATIYEKIDVVDVHRISDGMLELIEKDKIVWKS